MEEPVITIEEVTPEMAYAWLETNTDNRTLRTTKTNQYARDMKLGHWHVTGDPIKFNGDGTLKDGQHRLWACIEANTPFKTAVLRGLAHNAHAAIDVGAIRSMADELRWRRETNPPALAATLGVLWKYEHNAFLDPRKSPSRSELLDVLEQNPRLRDSMSLGVSTGKGVRIPVSVCAGMHYLFSTKTTDEEATGFFYLVRTEGAAKLDTAPLALRRYALNTYMQKNRRPTQAEWVALTIKAFNYWMANAHVRQLRWRRGGAQAEAFPEIVPSAFIGEGDGNGEHDEG